MRPQLVFIQSKFRTFYLFFAAIFLSEVALAFEVSDIRTWRAPDHTRVVFDLTGPIKHTLLVLENPDRVVVDLKNTQLKAGFQSLKLDKTPIKKIRSGKRRDGDLRIVLDLNQKVHPRSFFLQSNDKASDRLVVDLFDPVMSAVRSNKKLQALSNKRDVIIAIDAGHGGEDPGAIGPNGLQEKLVVQRIARNLNKLFDNEKGFTSVLIRDGDYYLSLKRRRQLARQSKADAFISIHADAFKNKNVNGASVYALSTRGASSTAASYLAKRANSADLIGGVSLSDKDNLLASVLTDLSMTATLDASLNLGSRVLNSLSQSSKLHKKSVEQAAFAVLKSPDIPSILIETGFISNPIEAKKLSSRDYQRNMAKNIFRGIVSWFQAQPPPGTYLAWRREKKIENYTIVDGDTLSTIALRFDVPMELIKDLNELRGNSIYAGKVLKIPMDR